VRTLVLGIGNPLFGDNGVFAVETQEVTEITAEMTKKVKEAKEAVPKIMSLILEEVNPNKE